MYDEIEMIRRATGCTPQRAKQIGPHLIEGMLIYGIDTPIRKAEFFAQIGHESGSLRYLEELWGPTPAQKRYEGRVDLGNVHPGDGSRFRGRGLIQITGRSNHKQVREGLRIQFKDVPDFEAEPEKLAEPRWAALSACWYWHSRGLNRLADAGEFFAICQRINGGSYGLPNGLEDRQRRRALCMALL